MIPKSVDLNAVVLELPLLKQIIANQITALQQQGANPDWHAFTRTDVWPMMAEKMTVEAQLRWELHWRICYKSNFIQEALMKHAPTANLVHHAMAAHAAVYIWRECCDDNSAFEPLQPPLAPYRIQEMALPEIRLRVASLFADHRRVDVVKVWLPCPADTNGDGDCGKPACPYCGIDVNREPRTIMNRPFGDIDLLDWERHMTYGTAPDIELRWADTGDVHMARTEDAMRPGVIIGSTGGDMYQRMENGSLVNITKHPEKRRRDLE